MMRGTSLLCLLLAGCGSSETTAQPPADSGVVESGAVVVDAAPDAPSPLPFSLCPAGYSGACLTLDVPLDHDAPAGRTIKLLVNRIVSVTAPKGQLYMLQGGPGGSAVDLVPLALALGKVLDGFEIYTIEHRGVGASDRLGCKG